MTGARLGVDVGTVRIGVAVAPAGVSMAVPVETVPGGAGAVDRILTLIGDLAVDRVYVGDPLTLSGHAGPAAEQARAFAVLLANRAGTVDVRMVDERLTTAQSGRQLRAAGRNTRTSRNVVDQAAAVAILQNAVDLERSTGRAAGDQVERDER